MTIERIRKAMHKEELSVYPLTNEIADDHFDFHGINRLEHFTILIVQAFAGSGRWYNNKEGREDLVHSAISLAQETCLQLAYSGSPEGDGTHPNQMGPWS